MKIAESKVTSQGQVSVPAEVRKLLGVGPGSTLEWESDGERVTVRRASSLSFEDLHRQLFPDGPPPGRSVEEMDEGIRRAVRERFGRAGR